MKSFFGSKGEAAPSSPKSAYTNLHADDASTSSLTMAASAAATAAPSTDNHDNVTQQEYAGDEMDVIAGVADMPRSMSAADADYFFAIGPAGGQPVNRVPTFRWNPYYARCDYSDDLINKQQGTWVTALSTAEGRYWTSFPKQPHVAERTAYMEFHFGMPSKMSLSEFTARYSRGGRIVLPLDNKVLALSLGDRIKNVTTNDYDIIVYNVEITSMRSTLPCTYKARLTAKSGPRSTDPVQRSGGGSGGGTIAAPVTSRVDWFQPMGISSTATQADHATYHQLVYPGTLHTHSNTPIVAFKASAEVNSADFTRWLEVDFRRLCDDILEHSAKTNGYCVFAAPSENERKTSSMLVFMAWTYWAQLHKYTPASRNKPEIKSSEASGNARYIHVAKEAMIALAQDIEKRVDKPRRVMRLDELQLELTPISVPAWTSVVKRSEKTAMSTPGMLPDNAPEFDMTINVTYDLYKGNLDRTESTTAVRIDDASMTAAATNMTTASAAPFRI